MVRSPLLFSLQEGFLPSHSSPGPAHESADAIHSRSIILRHSKAMKAELIANVVRLHIPDAPLGKRGTALART
jgi:hypothetical protein